MNGAPGNPTHDDEIVMDGAPGGAVALTRNALPA